MDTSTAGYSAPDPKAIMSAQTGLPAFTVSPEYAAKMAAQQAAAQAPKPGIFTTEFWLHIAALVVPAALQALMHSDNPTIMVVAQVAASVYTMSRTGVKMSNQKQVGTVTAAAVSTSAA